MALQDAYLPWAVATDFRGAGGAPGPDRWIRLLLQTVEGTSVKDFATAAGGLPPGQWIAVARHYADPLPCWADTRHCTALVSPAFLAALTGTPAPPALDTVIAMIERFEIGFVEEAPPARSAAPPAVPAPLAIPPRVVVGVIDDGIAFAHHRFRGPAPGSTRLLSMWDQGPPPGPGAPPTFGYGRLYDRGEIGAALVRHAHPSTGVEEDALYADLGYAQARRSATHGTHVLDLACGEEPRQIDGDTPWIVGVQLPGDAVEDTSCASIAAFLLDAIRHVVEQADAACGTAPCPVVVNVSLGDLAGPHNGSSLIEEAIDELIATRRTVASAPLRVVFAAGNSYLTQGHAWISLPKGSGRLAAELPWRVQPCDGSPSFVEIWFNEVGELDGAQDVPVTGFTVELCAPDGSTTGPVAASDPPRFLGAPAPAHAPMAMVHFCTRSANGRGPLALIALAPSSPAERELHFSPKFAVERRWPALAPSGVWTIKIANDGRFGADCHAYVQRDDASMGRRSLGRQSRFDEPQYRRFDDQGRVEENDLVGGVVDSYARRIGTLNGMATGREVDVAAAAQAVPGGHRIARYAASDIPGSGRPDFGWDVAAVADDSPVLFGVLAAGTRSGSCVAVNGSSVAAPLLTRALARSFATGHGGALPTGLPTVVAHDDSTVPVIAPSLPQQARAQRRRGG